MAINTSTLFNLIKNEKGTNIKKIERTGRWPIGKNSSKIAQVIVRAIDRFDAVDHIIDVLEHDIVLITVPIKYDDLTSLIGNNVILNPLKKKESTSLIILNHMNQSLKCKIILM